MSDPRDRITLLVELDPLDEWPDPGLVDAVDAYLEATAS